MDQVCKLFQERIAFKYLILGKVFIIQEPPGKSLNPLPQSALRQEMLPQTLFLEEVVANLHPFCDQHRYPCVVAANQLRVCIDIHRGDVEAKFRTQALQRLRHIGTQMATPPDIDGQLPCQEFTAARMATRLVVFRYFDGKKGGTAFALNQ